MQRFENLVMWQKAKTLTIAVYDDFYTCSDRAYKDQIQRAAVSIMNNIAEGFERESRKELKRFLYIAKGSSGEVRSMLMVASDLRLLPADKRKELLSQSIEVSKIIAGYIKAL